MLNPLLEGIPIYERRQTNIDAAHYNLVRRFFIKGHSELRYPLPGLRTLDLILEEKAWIVVDRDLNDVPVLAWVNFKTEHRSAIHEPIACDLWMYHIHATVILEKVLALLDERMEQVLKTSHS